MSNWTYDGYWNAVLGAGRSTADVIRDFDLDPGDRRGVDEWLGAAESEAWAMGKLGGPIPDEWSDFHARALKTLCSV